MVIESLEGVCGLRFASLRDYEWEVCPPFKLHLQEEEAAEKEYASQEENEGTPARGVGKHTASRQTRATLQENVMPPTQ